MKRLLSVTAFSALLTLLRMVVGFVIAKVIAVYTGPSGMAMLGQIQSLVNGLNGLVTAPAGSGLVRYTAQYHLRGFAACAPWWRASIRWVLILLLCSITLVVLFRKNIALWLLGDLVYADLIILTALALPFSAFGVIVNSVINGQQHYRRYIILGMLSVLISSSVMICMVMWGGLKGALLAIPIQSGLIGFVLVLSSLRQPWMRMRYWWGNTGNKQKRSIAEYFLMVLTSALTLPISLILVRKILASYAGWEQAGHWQAVWKISEVYLSVITIAISTYYLPKLSALTIISEIKNETQKAILIIIPIVVSLAVGIYFLRDIVIMLLFTKSFTAARDLFAIQLTGDVVKVLSWLYAYSMFTRKMTKWVISTEIAFSCLFVLLSLLFVSAWGVQGANYAYLLNYILYFAFVVLIVRPLRIIDR